MNTDILTHLTYIDPSPSLSSEEVEPIAEQLGNLMGMAIYQRSLTAVQQALLCLGGQGTTKKFICLSTNSKTHELFEGQTSQINLNGKDLQCTIGPTTPHNAAALRQLLPYLNPQLLGLRKSAGCGDRLGLATPGHVRAIRHSTLAPIFAQQSMRENDRTGRTPQQVLDDAMWGVFQEGWRNGYGADADHLKTTTDVTLCAAAGYTFYTIDPGEYVDNSAAIIPAAQVHQKLETLPWDVLDSNPVHLQTRLTRSFDLGDFSVTLSQEEVVRAALKYGGAIAHTVQMYRHLTSIMGPRPFELEMSVDETDTITTLAEHIYIASELKRLGVRWVSLAPRYVGTFEKGVDYIGDLAKFEESFAQHIAVAQTFGPYKLSLHSGSDKFSIYPIAAHLAGELVHLKTAGTSYLEALRAIAQLNPALFREIVAFAVSRYPIDQATYHVSGDTSKMPDITVMSDSRLTALLNDFHGREILHVTFGSVLNHPPFREPLFTTLRQQEEIYAQILEMHFIRHFQPFE